MRIQTNIFLWGFLAFVLPLTALALIATYYSQANYLEDTRKNIDQHLGMLSSEIERRLAADRALTYGLAQAPAIHEFLAVLDNISQQNIGGNFNKQINAVNQFFEGFQAIIPGTFFIRILDNQGNTVVKVSNNLRSQPVYDNLQGFSYVEQELNNPIFITQLRELPQDEVSSMVLPHNKVQSALLSHLSLLDNVIPLYHQNKWVGALSLTLLGEDLDKILNHAIRPFDGSLLIIETNPDIKNRHGLILFDDMQKLRFAHARSDAKYLQDTDYSPLIELAQHNDTSILSPSVVSTQKNNTLYFTEMTPYPSQFVNWIMALSISDAKLNQPYAKIRLTIWSVAGITLLIGLILTQIGARRVTRAFSDLILNFKNYAQGDHSQIAITEHCVDEIKDLGKAFNEMTNTLNIAHKDRDKAQQMMLQSSKLASIGQMAAGIGHEINNPLNNILSYAKLTIRNLENNPKLTQQDKQPLLSDLQSLREETLRASDIVKGIMNFARQVPPHFTEFNIKDWLESSIALVQQSASEKFIHLNLEINPDLSEQQLKGDRSQLQQVLVNLLLNAIYASKTDTTVHVNASINNTQIEISIIDNGAGIKAKNLDLIFDPFFSTKGQGHGTGLGLSISLGIIQDHQGELKINNRTGNNGVIAKIILPL
ncbi:hypothetical protein MNBD_GAMMA23-442 [hydrothermal vent metagenome]|uniref:histidine kinase n=1 Tax=hydrothermal vent metagenome TaxID=652676 RepID=A0A3B1AMF8_9ZZZZ